MKFRLHRGLLEESMKTMCEVNSKAELAEVLTKELPISVTEEMLHVSPYAYDSRIDWNTYIVTIDNYGVAGFTNGPI
jgi:hypothetical protein